MNNQKLIVAANRLAGYAASAEQFSDGNILNACVPQKWVEGLLEHVKLVDEAMKESE